MPTHQARGNRNQGKRKAARKRGAKEKSITHCLAAILRIQREQPFSGAVRVRAVVKMRQVGLDKEKVIYRRLPPWKHGDGMIQVRERESLICYSE